MIRLVSSVVSIQPPWVSLLSYFVLAAFNLFLCNRETHQCCPVTLFGQHLDQIFVKWIVGFVIIPELTLLIAPIIVGL